MKAVVVYTVLLFLAAVVPIARADYATTDVKGRWFDRIILFMFENHAYDEVIQNPHFSKFARMGRQFTKYFAVTHPSQPNYWTQTAGDFFGINSDSNFDLDKSNIVDLLDKKGITWKSYQEDYPGNCFTGRKSGKYYRKHNPFMSYDNIRNNATRCANIVNSNELDMDLANGTLPQYMYFTPNIENDAHNTNIKWGGKWLDGYLSPRVDKFPPGTLILITWDEDDYTEANMIDTVMFGSMIAAGSKDDQRYDHYSLLKTVEDNWHLGNLGRHDAHAVPFRFH